VRNEPLPHNMSETWQERQREGKDMARSSARRTSILRSDPIASCNPVFEARPTAGRSGQPHDRDDGPEPAGDMKEGATPAVWKGYR
jgi:hypothetical protein